MTPGRRLAQRRAALALLVCAAVIGVAGFVVAGYRDAPLSAKQPAVDVTDVYAFVSPGASDTVTLMANWMPASPPAGGPSFYHFDDLARYYIKVDSDGDGVEDVSFEWVFNSSILNPNTPLYATGPISSPTDPDYNFRQRYTVTKILGPTDSPTGTEVLGTDLVMPPDNVGPRVTPDYPAIAAQAVYDAPGGIKLFAGQRDDPSFVDRGSIYDLVGLRPFGDRHTVPQEPGAGGDAGAGFNVEATAVRVPSSALAPTCPGNASDERCAIGVWATAELPETITRTGGGESGSASFEQVARLGNPLVNEIVMPLGLKDVFNNLAPSADGAVPQILNVFNDPEAARLLCTLYDLASPGLPCSNRSPAARTAPRDDLHDVYLRGITGLNRQVDSGSTESEQLRLNTAIAPAGPACQGNRLGFLAGDNAGYPNGRRLEDDVTDATLRILAGGYSLTPAFAQSPNNELGDGVDGNDLPCLDAFPYAPTPTSGFASSTPPPAPGPGTGPPPGPGAGGQTGAPQRPVLSDLTLAPTAFRAAGSGPTVQPAQARRTGTIVSYENSQMSTTTFTIRRARRGIRRGRRCVRRPRNPPPNARRCTRYRRVGSFTNQDPGGPVRFRFSGRIGGRKLRPGRYRLRAVAGNAAGRSNRLSANFRIRRPR